MSVRPAKIQISLGIHPVWSESSLSAWRKLPIERTAKTLIRLGGCPGWSESSLGAHSLCQFCHVVDQILTKEHRQCLKANLSEHWINNKIQKSKFIYRGNLTAKPKTLIWCKTIVYYNLLTYKNITWVFYLVSVLCYINPYKPSVPFLGHRQTVQTQIRWRRTRRLIRVFTVC